MQGELPYTSSIKDMPFMFPEMRRTAKLLCERKTGNDIVQLSMEKNIYQLEREKRRRDVPLRMLKRLGMINKPLLDIVANGREDDAKLVVFLALMKADRLLFEFMYEVYASKFHSGYNEIADKDFHDFIERKIQNSNAVAKWTPNNLIRVRNTYKNILCEAGLAKRTGALLLLRKPILEPHFRKLLDAEEAIYAKVLLWEV